MVESPDRRKQCDGVVEPDAAVLFGAFGVLTMDAAVGLQFAVGAGEREGAD